MKRAEGKKTIVKCLLLGLLLCLLLGTGAQASWKKTAKGTRYYISKQKGYARGFQKIKGKWYYFNKKGYLQKTGWTNIGGKRYYLTKKTGRRMTGGWFRVGKYYYYADKKGVVQRNRWIDGCYVKKNYRRASGWLELDGARYYLNPDTGKKTTGLKTIGEKKYFFSKAGVMQKNKWKKVKKKYYYLQEDGSAATNVWIGKYRVGASGAALTGLQVIDGSSYYFDGDGVMQTGWQEIDDKLYYFDELGIMLKNSTAVIEGVSCTFGENGECTDSGLGLRIVQYALMFEGNPYAYGGNDLLTGVDCSGFTSQVLKHFKIYVPRTADDQRKGKDAYGTYTESVKVQPKLSALLPGDLLFYGTKKPAYAGHVALYIGNGKIIHASDESTGIVISDYDYRKPIAARRYWK